MECVSSMRELRYSSPARMLSRNASMFKLISRRSQSASSDFPTSPSSWISPHPRQRVEPGPSARGGGGRGRDLEVVDDVAHGGLQRWRNPLNCRPVLLQDLDERRLVPLQRRLPLQRPPSCFRNRKSTMGEALGVSDLTLNVSRQSPTQHGGTSCRTPSSKLTQNSKVSGCLMRRVACKPDHSTSTVLIHALIRSQKQREKHHDEQTKW
eukprot:768033-Hanusia_phi.AAC.6